MVRRMAKVPKKTAKTGRPEKPDDERKDEVIRIRVTPEEKAELVAAAKRAGHEVSPWLRGLGLREARRENPGAE